MYLFKSWILRIVAVIAISVFITIIFMNDTYGYYKVKTVAPTKIFFKKVAAREMFAAANESSNSENSNSSQSDFITKTPPPKKPSKYEKAMQMIRKRENEIADSLYEEEKILCMILTTAKATERQNAIIETWGKRCQILLFFIGGNLSKSESLNNFSSMVTLQMNDTWGTTWIKVRMAIEYINKNYKNNFDWFLRADDDTFIIMENLRLFLSSKDKESPQMYGVDYKLYGGYIGTGAGITVSRTNFNKLVEHLNDSKCTKGATHNDDVEISNCLKLAGVKVADSRDDRQRFRFFPFNAETTLNRKLIPKWVWGWSSYNMSQGYECCADDYIGFHYVTPEQMRTMEFLIYYLHPFSDRNVWKRPDD